MTLYHICDCCRKIYAATEVEGPAGAVEVQGMCPDCALEIGVNTDNLFSGTHFYH